MALIANYLRRKRRLQNHVDPCSIAWCTASGKQQAIRTAIFVVTDDVSQSELESRDPDAVEEIQNARTILEAVDIDTSTKRLFN